MERTGIVRRIARSLVVLTLTVSVASLTSPGTAYAKHGNGAAIARGIDDKTASNVGFAQQIRAGRCR